MVLSSRGTVGDYTLYSIGALDIDELNDLVNSAMAADGKIETPESGADFTYDDALSTTFKVLSPADAYRKNEETGMWTDMSGDADFMTAKVADGIDVHIVGVVRPNETANASALSPGIAYTHALTRQLMERAADSQIVQEQLAHPETDVFTGKTFDELQGEAKQGVDLGSMFSVDEAALKSAFSFDASALSGAAGGMDFSGIDLSGLDIDLSGVGKDIDLSDIMAKAPTPDFSASLTVWSSRPSKCNRWERLPTNYLRAFCSLISLGRCHPKTSKTRQSLLPHSRRISRTMLWRSSAWRSSRRSAAMPWPSACNRR